MMYMLLFMNYWKIFRSCDLAICKSAIVHSLCVLGAECVINRKYTTHTKTRVISYVSPAMGGAIYSERRPRIYLLIAVQREIKHHYRPYPAYGFRATQTRLSHEQNSNSRLVHFNLVTPDFSKVRYNRKQTVPFSSRQLPLTGSPRCLALVQPVR